MEYTKLGRAGLDVSRICRTETDEAMTRLFARTEEAGGKVTDRVGEAAKARGIPRAQVALAWLLAKPMITAPIVGATKLHHLDDTPRARISAAIA
jgi:aryl-alcohol dehydrogenase-like predicted oxidoreductase